MRRVAAYSILLAIGLGLSQALPAIAGDAHDTIATAVRVLTMTGLAFIMIHVGFEFHIDRSNLKQYGWDYVVAFTAASFPWVFVTGYFMYGMLPSETWTDLDAWKETLLAGRFAAPTSAGVLFSMLAAAGLGATWLFSKARVLAIFDDLDTVLLMIPLKMHRRDRLAAWPCRRADGRPADNGLCLAASSHDAGDVELDPVLRRGDRGSQRTALRREQNRGSVGADSH